MKESGSFSVLACVLVLGGRASADELCGLESTLVMTALPNVSDTRTASDATAANEHCQVVGVAWTPGSGGADSRAVLWDLDAGTAVDLGTTVIPAASDPWQVVRLVYAAAWGINEGGQVVAQVRVRFRRFDGDTPVEFTLSRAALWEGDAEGGAFQLLGTLPGREGSFSTARGINDHGDLVGHSANQPFVWHADTAEMQPLPTLVQGGFAIPYAINNAGEIVGQASLEPAAEGATVPVAWVPGADGYDLVVLANHAGNDTNRIAGFARAINDHGLIGGVDVVQATAWDVDYPDGAFELRSAGTINGVNGLGELAGYHGVNGGNLQGLYLPGLGAEPVLLGTLPEGRSSFVRFITDGGLVGGSSDQGDRQRHAFVVRVR